MLVKNGRKKLLDYLLSDPTLAATFHLCKNNPAPADADIVIGDLTEADFVGYAPIAGIAFPGSVINGAFHGETLSATQTWTAGALVGAQTIFAAYMTLVISGTPELIFFRRFSASITLMNPGDLVEKKFDMLSDDSNVPAFG